MFLSFKFYIFKKERKLLKDNIDKWKKKKKKQKKKKKKTKKKNKQKKKNKKQKTKKILIQGKVISTK